ncbi:amino acid adenylation domain-containing protein [Cryptosporangium sp. NPDC051539]|uniref:amino acid adenylation domain-containing protein n=1 Tax=Cryptosporangium sp. NPDC051539 TaxID=3363962 RepID=UPI00378F1F07
MTAGPDLTPAHQALLRRRLARRPATTRIAPRPTGVQPPLSFAQEQVWFMEQYSPGTPAYLTPVAIRLEGPVDREVLQHALDALVARHESLRTAFPAGEDGIPRAVVSASASLLIEDVAEGDLRSEVTRGFDLAAGPPVRALLVASSGLLVLAAHHLVLDGWSADTLVGELLALCRGDTLAALPIGYGDYARWQREESAGDLAGHRRYWRQRLADVPPLDLPADRPRRVSHGVGSTHRLSVDAELTARLTALGAAHGATLFMTLLAAYQVLLARHSGQDDFAVGSPVAGRTRPETEPLVGMFVNMLALRADLTGDPSFIELLARTRRSVLDALAHQELPFGQVVSDLGSPRGDRAPVFQTSFALHNFQLSHAADWHPLDVASARYEVELQAVVVDGELQCTFVHDDDLFAPATGQRWARRFSELLRSIVETPGTAIRTLGLLPSDERTLLLDDWNATDRPRSEGETLAGLVSAQILRTPDAPAVSGEHGTLTYSELDQQAERVAHSLRARGVDGETLVGVLAERGPDLIAALLGVTRTGAVYVPLDPDHPAGRLAYLLADSGATVLLTQRRWTDLLTGTTADVLLLDDVLADAPVEIAAPSGGNEAAYLLYTSGSTGRPKGALNTHAAICNRLRDLQERHPLTAADAVLHKTPLGFDVAVWEVFWPLSVGARLVIARPGGHQDPAYLRDVIAAERVTTAHFVPSMLTHFVAEPGIERCRDLRQVMCGGESLPADAAARLVDRLPGCTLHNFYGPAEAAVDVSVWPYGPLPDGVPAPIGRPIANARLYVLDAGLAPVPIGVTGELCVGGLPVGLGYWRRPELTAERFVPDPFGPPGARLYRTGDRARWTGDGLLEFRGRVDTQVKLRGQRVELGEIEARLREQPGVTGAAVLVREDTPGDQRLVAYLTPEPDDPAAVREALRQALPDFMVPTSIVGLDALPLNPNGKLDRAALAALPAPGPEHTPGRGYVEPRPGVETTIAKVWAEVLGRDRVGALDDFFDLGGHSLLAVQVVARLRKELAGTGHSVGVMDVFTHRTVRGLAADRSGPRPLLHELTPPAPSPARSYVCLPYGGGSAAVYQPLADALPAGHRVFALAIPGHDVGLDEQPLPFDELARRTVDEVLERVEGPLVLYGHCGVGGALVVEVARRLEAAGRVLDTVYVGAIFPFARGDGPISRLQAWWERRVSDRLHAIWLKSGGVDLDELDPEQADRIVGNMRADSRQAEAYFSDLLAREVPRLRAPVVSVAGERDPSTLYYEERYREWGFLTSTSALVMLAEAGHFFLKFRADDLAEILTRVGPAVADGEVGALTAEARPGRPWWLHEVHRAGPPPEAAADRTVRPSMRRFAAVATGQIVSMTGSALTAWAVPIWIYLRTGSLGQFTLFAVTGLLPVLLIGPVAGAIVDRTSRRTVMAISGIVAGGGQAALAVLYASDRLQPWHLYVGVALVASALTFQRLAFTSAVPQLVPKPLLGNANGLAQLTTGVATLLVPLVAAGALATIGLGGILLVDVISYAAALGMLAVVRFPSTMAFRRREPLLVEVTAGWRYSWGTPALRATLIFSALINIVLGPALVLVSPLVLTVGSLTQVGRVAFAQALGAVVGGLLFAVWGGPARRRMRGMLLVTLALGACCLVAGLRPSVALIAVGLFGVGLTLTLVQAIYTTIVQIKVPQRFHGRVFALNQMIAWSTLPLSFAVLAPLAVGGFRRVLADDDGFTRIVGAVIGGGPGREIGLVYVVVALAVTVLAGTALRRGPLSRFDTAVPDAPADDEVGVAALRTRPGPD